MITNRKELRAHVWIFVFLLMTGIAKCNLTFYGNEIKDRSTSGMDSRITPVGPRIWIDDPLDGDSWPEWGYLQFYHVYIGAVAPAPFSSVPLPGGLYLQVWSNTSMVNNYSLKWQRKLEEGYQTGRAYQIAPEPGEVVEVNGYDRIGFTSEGNGSSVALDFETDDQTLAATAHRTYFRLLSRDNYALPVIGDYRLMDNNALRGRFSVGITLDNAPPRKSTEVYAGNDLIRRPKIGIFSTIPLLDDSILLPTGRITAFYFRLCQLTASTSVQLNIWRSVPGSETNFTLVYNRNETIGSNPEKTYNLSIIDGPLVNGSFRLGWSSDKIFFSSDSGACRQVIGNSMPKELGQVYAFDSFRYPYRASIGVIVDTQTQPVMTSSVNRMTSLQSPSSNISRNKSTGNGYTSVRSSSACIALLLFFWLHV